MRAFSAAPFPAFIAASRRSAVAVFALVFPLLSPSPAASHQYRGMATQATIEAAAVEARVRLAHQDIVLLAPRADRNRDGNLSPDEFEQSRDALVRATAASLLVTDNGQPAVFTTGTAEITGEGIVSGNIDELLITVAYAPAEGGTFGSIHINPNLFRNVGEVSPISGEPILGSPLNTVTILDQGTRVVLIATGKEVYDTAVESDATTGTAIADAGKTPPPPHRRGTSLSVIMTTFFWEGILHIVMGWDHILFVIGLVLLSTRFIELLKVITAFTVAHSITLLLTSLDVIPIRGPGAMAFIEAFIAVTVAYVGLENIIRLNSPPKWRWALVFGFGLIHGFGFASVLRDLLVDQAGGGRGTAVASLLMFNLGVEAGQIMVVAALFPVLVWLRRQRPVVWRRVAITGSALVLFMGVSWTVDRTVLPGTLPWVAWFEE